MSRPFLKRICKISRAGDPPQTLTIALYKPTRAKSGEYVARAKLRCSYFELPAGVAGEDELQAFAGIMTIVLGVLRRLIEEEGYKIFWLAEGDIFFDDFWTYRRGSE